MQSVYAYIVLAGGGMKGPVLAGCLKAAEDKGVKPRGFGGTSAGSIVAMLSSLGYSGSELKDILIGQQFTDLLDDGGPRLNALKMTVARLSENLSQGWIGGIKALWRMSQIKRLMNQRYGLYRGDRLRDFLAAKIQEKFPDTKDARKVTFDELAVLGAKPLRLVATDLDSKRAVVFGTGTSRSNASVVDAVIASASYPLLFEPVNVDSTWLSDGGLSSSTVR